MGNAATVFHLTRSIALPGDSTLPAVTGAHLQVEGSDNSIYPLTETGNGYYSSPAIRMNTATRYRLHITNVNKEEYLSDYVPFKPTPPIDSVNWIYDSTGVNFYTTTHDPTGKTRFYDWKCIETWEVTASEGSIYVYQGDTMAKRTPAQQIDTCWHTDSSADILVGTSEQLEQDEIFQHHLLYVPINTEQIGIEYSLLVDQYALTDSGYNFLNLMRSNSEQLGSIMDPQPSQITGNIHSKTNPTEPVLGFVSAGTVQQTRIFITRNQVPNWLYYFECPGQDFEVGPGQYQFYFGRDIYTPIGPGAAGVYANYASCIDCRLRDGFVNQNANQKPAFWH
jgi:hypothetical protein